MQALDRNPRTDRRPLEPPDAEGYIITNGLITSGVNYLLTEAFCFYYIYFIELIIKV